MVRIKHRYLLVHILYPGAPKNASKATEDVPWAVQFHQPTSSNLTTQLLIRALRNQVQFLFGDWGAGVTSSSLSIKYFSPATSTFILRVARDHYRIVAAALAWITELSIPTAAGYSGARDGGSGGQNRTECVLRVVRVSGTIRKSEEEAIRKAKELVWRLRGLDQDKTAQSGFASGDQHREQAVERPHAKDDSIMSDGE